MKTKLFILFLLPVLFLSTLNAQQNSRKITIKGTVRDVYRSPIRNAIVMIDGQNTSMLTDAKGNFKIKVSRKAYEIGVFTFGNGIISQPIKGRTLIDFNFGTVSNNAAEPSNPSAEQGVDIGYGSVKKRNLTQNVTNIDGTNKKYASYSSIYEMIEREVSGVKVYNDHVVLVGSTNMGGEVEPMYVVDGTYVSTIDNIKPTSVESISVLKDASAAIYGSRAFGGVILIKTKTQN
jgi:TonB-dependent starch-binding outer membrane protein SusC